MFTFCPPGPLARAAVQERLAPGSVMRASTTRSSDMTRRTLGHPARNRQTRSRTPTPELKVAPPHAGDRYRCSLPGLAGFTGQRWQDHRGCPKTNTQVARRLPRAHPYNEGGVADLAERKGFEPPVPSRAHTISSRAPSTARSPLQGERREPLSGLISPPARRTRGRNSEVQRPTTPDLGGEQGIRTLGTVTGTLDFESSSFDRSDSSPRPGP